MMSLSKKIFLLSSVLLMTHSYCADEDEDVQSLRDWLRSKRLVTVKDLGGNLSFSGDVHAQAKIAQEKKDGVDQRVVGTSSSPNQFEIKAYLTIDYRTDTSWATIKTRYENQAGIFAKVGSGTHDKLKLDQAYWGYRLIDNGPHTLELEVGRRGQLSGFYESRIGFASNFDGINIKNNYVFDNCGSFYLQGGVFVINKDRHQLGYLGEMGLLDIGNTGFYTKYSLIDWDTQPFLEVPSQFHFIVSQLTLGYKWRPEGWNNPVTMYAAGIHNHRAQSLPLTNETKANQGGYFGFSIGKLKNAGDWSFDFNYQVLQAQALPDFDVQGVGLGTKSHFYFTRQGGNFIPTNRYNAEGNVNYQGFEVILQYLLTPNLNIFQKYRRSSNLNYEIGPARTYYQYEVDFIYLF